jgi:hypothetical protein
MTVLRTPEIDERVKLRIAKKQRQEDSGDRYLLRHEGQTGEVIEKGDEFAPAVYKVRFSEDDLPALVAIDNLRTQDGEPFKPSGTSKKKQQKSLLDA